MITFFFSKSKIKMLEALSKKRYNKALMCLGMFLTRYFCENGITTAADQTNMTCSAKTLLLGGILRDRT